MRGAGALASMLVATACTSVPAQNSDLAARFEAAVLGYCLAFIETGEAFVQPTSVRGFELTPLGVLPPEYPRRIGELDWLVGDFEPLGFVSVGREMSADHGPLCSVSARGPGAGAAVVAFAGRLRSRRSGWSQVEGMPYDSELTPEFGENEQRRNDWVARIRLDMRPESNSAFIERVPIWNEEEHPEEPTLAEIEAAEAMSLEEALTAAVVEIALPMARQQESSEPAALRRLQALGSGTVAGVFVMRMSNPKGNIVGVEQTSPSHVTVTARGESASHAKTFVWRRLSRMGWVRSQNEAGQQDSCLASPEGDLRVCAVEVAAASAVRIEINRVSPDSTDN